MEVIEDDKEFESEEKWMMCKQILFPFHFPFFCAPWALLVVDLAPYKSHMLLLSFLKNGKVSNFHQGKIISNFSILLLNIKTSFREMALQIFRYFVSCTEIITMTLFVSLNLEYIYLLFEEKRSRNDWNITKTKRDWKYVPVLCFNQHFAPGAK